jgi:hypothetical protein
LTTLLLGLVTWQKWAEYSSKEMLMTNIRSALGMAISTETLSRQLAEDYERLRPVLARQRQTMDALQTLALLQTVRSNQTFWYVLFADHLSYFTAVPWGTTNAAATGAESPVTNSAMAALATTPGFVVELCVPEEGDALRQTLSRVVAELKQSRLFTNVDSLSIDRRRSLVDPQVLLPDRHFSLNLETGGDYARPLAPPERRRAPASTVTTEGRSSAKAIGSTNVLERGN